MAWPRRYTKPRQVLPRHRWLGHSPARRLWDALKWWLAAALLAGSTWYFLGSDRIGPETLPPGGGEAVAGPFVRCGQGRAAGCVADGDTLIIGRRTIRIIGIDAPELHPARCPAEAQAGEAAAQALLGLVNQGPFALVDPGTPARDDYGRELKHLLRQRGDGSVQSLADDLVAGGHVRPYLRGPREPWC
jgi:micrococcal nuclease